MRTRWMTVAVVAAAVGIAAGQGWAGPGGARVPVGEFHAAKLDKAPTIDGKIDSGEWDRALTTSGMITVFDHQLLMAETTMSFAYDDTNFYFLFNCGRSPGEGRLSKKARENDDYSYGDPSIEIWVTPPTAVAETYQNIINTYPSVMDIKNIPSRGYVGQGWKGHWTLGVTESPDRYIIEASVAIKDFGFDSVKDGDVWQFLLCRTAVGAKPRPQASWSVTQGFSEIPQHPRVHLMGDVPVLQVLNTVSVFTGQYDFPMAVSAGSKGATVEVELRWQSGPQPAAGDKVEKKTVSLKANERKELAFQGATPAKKGCFSITAVDARSKAALFRQTFPYEVNGFVPQAPAPVAAAPLAIATMYGPETNTVLVKADVLDLPEREQIASAEVRLLDGNKVLKTQTLPPFVEWYSVGPVALEDVKGLKIPVQDLTKWVKAEGDAKPAQPPAVTPLTLTVEVAVKDASGKTLKSERKDVQLKRYKTPWENTKVGVTDKVIPPWTPMTVSAETLGVWNRKMTLDGLGLLKKVDNGGTDQVRSMRLVAVQDGKEVPIAAGDAKVTRKTPARVDLAGEGSGAGLKLSAKTAAEFDGFVLIDLTIAPQAGATKVDNLYLEVVLPEEEATHFCSTAGGWTAVTDATPAYWSSQSTASGMLLSSFVPYVWLTNSDRAFLWFADSDEGWITDDTKQSPTVELIRKDGTVTLRVHFIEVPAELTAPRTLTYGYQTFPSRPLPKGWRGIVCTNNTRSFPNARGTYFWEDADWAVLWPYYSSPFPRSMAKSKSILDRSRGNKLHRPMPGSIAHSIGRYSTYEGAPFPEYVVDWACIPGINENANVTNSQGPNDFRLYNYQRWVKEAGLRGIYVDENYLSLEDNFLTGNAYYRPDGRLQRAYSYIGLRDYFKRLKIMFHENGAEAPNLWQHISSGAAYHSWFGEVFFEGENVEPTNIEYDYIEVLPAVRMRAIGSAVCAGGAMTMMCQSQRHRTQWEPKHTHQFVGWVMAHDILPEQVPLYYKLAEAGHLYEDDVEFLPYWKGEAITTDTPECVVSAHKTKGRALLWVVNTARKDQTVQVAIDFAKLGLNASRTKAVNPETGEPLKLTAKGLSVPVLQRDFIPVLLEAK